MIYMDVDTALAEVPVNYLPLVSDSDWKTRNTSLAYNAAGMDLVWNFLTPDGTHTQTAVTPAASGNYAWTSQGKGHFSIQMPASGGASINNDTEGYGWFSGLANGVLPWVGPIICFRAAGLNDKLIESAYSATRGLSGTALPNASADAAGGLPVSDAGGLDLDTLLARLDAAITTRAAAADVATIAEIVAAIEAGDVGTILTIAQKLDTALELDGAVYRFTTNALENAPAGGGGSSDWTAGEREQIRSALGVDGTKTAATGGQLQALDTVADAVKAKTDNLPADPADASDLAALLSAISSAIGTRAAPGDAMALTSGERAALGSALGSRAIGPTTADRLLLAIMAGLLAKTSGGGTGTVVLRNLEDTADLATITVDENDNRTAVTIIWENA